MTNAIYFKARWRDQFIPGLTRDEPFTTGGGKSVRARLMHQLDHFTVGSFDGGQILELPYGSGQLAMDVILPAKKDGLARVEQLYAAGGLTGWLATLRSAREWT